MRAFLALTFLVAIAFHATGDEPASDEALPWQPPFAAVSASEPFSMVVMLITNDDAFGLLKAKEAAEVDVVGQVPPWCQIVFERSYRKALGTRPDLKGRCFLQYLPAGMPQSLTGGSPRNQPSRAIIAICDGNYQLLSLGVGVPDSDELLTMIEDAQQVHSMIQLHRNQKARISGEIADRSMTRITRLWRDALKAMLATMDVGVGEADDGDLDEGMIATLGRIALSFQEVYLTDVRTRFGLSQAADKIRLTVLEQHPEARQPWCESMMPFIAGTDFLKTWKPLTEAVWHVTPVSHRASADELLAWWDTQVESEHLVLALQSPLLMRQSPWPPVDVGSVAASRGLGWQDLQKLFLEMPYRNVDTEQLAVLVRDRDLQPLDIQLPTRARYLFFEPQKRAPFVIREGDIPAKPIGRIKRAVKK